MQLLLVPLDDSILFPGMTATIAADVGDAERVFVLPRPEGEYGRIGTVAEVVEKGRLPGGLNAVTLTGLHRGRAGTASPGPGGELVIEVEELHDAAPADGRTRELERDYRAVVEEILELRGDDGRVAAFLRSIAEPGPLADTSGYSPDISGWPTSSGCWRPSTSPSGSSSRSSCSASGWPSFRSAAGSATTSSPAPRRSSASTSCASRWSRSARSSATTTPR